MDWWVNIFNFEEILRTKQAQLTVVKLNCVNMLWQGLLFLEKGDTIDMEGTIIEYLYVL